MSDEALQAEARRWLITAENELTTARILRDNARHAPACFHSQQAAEKAVKALLYLHDREVRGHAVARLLERAAAVSPELAEKVKGFSRKAAELDRYYIPTRYPNGLPELTPDEAYFDSDSERALAMAGEIIQIVRPLVG